MSVLARGLNFSVTPKEVPVAEIVTHVESCLTSAKLEPDVADAVRAEISASLMKKHKFNFNITCEEYSTLDMLRKDKDIEELPADKGQSTVVLDKVDYDKKVMTLLEDRDTYEVLTKDPTSKIRTRSCGLLCGLRNQGMLLKEQYFTIYTASEAPPPPIFLRFAENSQAECPSLPYCEQCGDDSP